jgi:hypothetical protein
VEKANKSNICNIRESLGGNQLESTTYMIWVALRLGDTGGNTGDPEPSEMVSTALRRSSE